jgi:hypothetical protein
MAQISEKAKKITKTLMVLPVVFVISLIPWLIVANLLSYYRVSEDEGWSGLAMVLKVSGIVLAVLTAAWMVVGLTFWLVQLVRIILGLDSRDEKHLA